ncbi:MAG: CDP-glycerol glycerophosphotransferase family protein [Lachnospiraceae bacterium]|nr:CDP-glycerol glycerophosphotransferase family protein [Lachnospiraceae bacterium]
MKTIKKIFKMFTGGFKFVKNYFSLNMVRRTLYAGTYKHRKIQEKTILYESFFGRGMLCGPYALFLEALSDERLKDFSHIWAIENKKELKRLKQEYKDHRNVRFIHYGFFSYIKYLASAKYLINNVSFPSFFTKKDGQIYVNTWHGIPLKTLGYDMPDGAVEVSNVLKNFMASDYMVSASPFLTEIYKKAYKLDGMYDGRIIEEGYPRLDILFCFKRQEIYRKLRALGTEIDENKQIILYAPTWKGVNYAHAEAGVDCYFEFKKKLESLIDTSKYQILVKPHQRVFQLAGDRMKAGFFVPAMIDANEILSVTDILVSDFSSIFYDYLATDRPVLFYIEDVESYKAERGMYHGLDHLPGPVSENIEGIAANIRDIDRVCDEWREKYAEVKAFADAGRKGGISRKIIDTVFFGKTEGMNLIKVSHEKTRIFISRGKMLTNGISTAFVNLLDNIDYSKYDVTAMITSCPEDRKVKLYQRINPAVRVIYRNSTFNMTLFENIVHRMRNRFGMRTPFHEVYEREWKRCYGGMHFDRIVDFEGYNYFYQLMLLQNKDVPKYIWLHNDMYEEYRTKYEWLLKIFKLYKYYDKVVACGNEIMKVNREKMCDTYIDGKKLTHADNLIDFNRVIELSSDEHISEVDNKPAYLVHEAYFTETYVKGGEILREDFDAEYMKYVPETDENGDRNIRFVTIGRLSPEKNQECLIKAFRRFHDEYKNAYLYILGDGALREDLQKLTESLGLTECVMIPGHVVNPYVVMKHCDCFILPSLHEGQPVVVHEARALKLPVIVSDFSSVSGVMTENGQLLIGHEEDDIFNGLKAFAEGKVPAGYDFNYSEFNKRAVNEFYDVLEKAV